MVAALRYPTHRQPGEEEGGRQQARDSRHVRWQDSIKSYKDTPGFATTVDKITSGTQTGTEAEEHRTTGAFDANSPHTNGSKYDEPDGVTKDPVEIKYATALMIIKGISASSGSDQRFRISINICKFATCLFLVDITRIKGISWVKRSLRATQTTLVVDKRAIPSTLRAGWDRREGESKK